MEEPQTAQNLVSAPCSNCGGQMQFSAAKQMLECPFCGHTQAIQVGTDMIVERSFSEALNLEAADTSGFGVERKQIDCKNCGAKTTIPADAPTVECDFCGSKNVNEEAYDAKTIRPQGVIPFQLEKRQATDKFKEWIGKGFFYASGLKKVQNVDEITAVYVPFWTYDAMTDSTWWAEAGYYYYETEYYTDQNGNQQSREVQRVRWVPASGYFSHHFDDVTVVASKGLSQHRVERIYPFQLERLVNYDPQFLLGKNAEVYALNVQQGYDVADGIMDKFIYAECGRLVPGDTYRNLTVNTHKSNITFKHILLPIWIAAYIFHGKSYQVVVNGQTGKISGEKPLSWFKIILTLLVVVAIAVSIYLFVKHKQGH